MKGKKLIELFNTLNKSNKHVILNKCKSSNDKRHKELYLLLKSYNGNNKNFQKLLTSIGENLTVKNSVNHDKAIRRFVDFAINLVEDVIIQEYLNQNKPLRNSILTNIFKNQNNGDLQEIYLRKLSNSKLETLDDNIQEQYYDHSIFLSSRSLKHQDFEKWWDLIGKKYELSNRIYLDKITEIFELASTSYLIDKRYSQEILDKMMEYNHLKLIKDVVTDDVKLIEIKLAEVRFSFEDKGKSFKLMNEIQEDFESLSLDEEDYDFLYRKINFISFLLAFNYNQPLDEIKTYNKNLLSLTTKHNRPDSLNKFYLVLLKITENKNLILEDEIAEIQTDFALHNDEYLLDFLSCFYAFVNGDFKSSLLYVNDLSYAPNLYVRIWSKQIELLIHYKKENFDLCETLADRILRQMKQMESMPYTLASSAQFLIEIHKTLSLKTPSLYKNLAKGFVSYSIIHNTLIKHTK